MKNLTALLTDRFEAAIQLAYPTLPIKEKLIEIAPSSQEKFGHYQFNSAMKLARLVQSNPRQVAEKILSHLDKGDNFISQAEIAGPGFINITLDTYFLSNQVGRLLREKHLGIDPPKKIEKVIVDFSSPNVAKEMHVGHLRSTIIGDSLARLFEFLGHKVLRLNHIGDWGTAFGMLIAYMKDEAPAILNGQQHTDLPHLMNWYRASKKKFDEDPAFKKRSQLEVVALQAGDVEARRAWMIICSISRKAYQEIYDLLDIKITERGESFYNPFLKELVADLDSKKMTQLSEGAKCLFIEGFQNRDNEPLPLMIQKSDGGYNYATTDLAAIRHRIEQEKADRILYVIDAGQSIHMQMIFKAAEKVGYLDPAKISVHHVAFGLVLGPDGKKFKTRSGETEKLIDLLTAAVEQADKILMERNPEMNETERKKLAQALGIGAIKYADLSCNRVNDYSFSYDRMLKFEGNTAAFLMYSYVRVGGIKRRLQVDLATILNKTSIELEHPSEIALGLHLLRFNEALNSTADEMLPNRLTDYLYVLAEKFGAFFRDCRVEGTPQQNSRLLLAEATARVMKQGLDILGVPTVDRM